jgi:hypothetical protein
MPVLIFVLVVLIVVALVAAVALAITSLRGYRQAVLRALPLASAQPPTIGCALPTRGLPAAGDPNLTLRGNESASDLRGGTITLPAGVSFSQPLSNLTLIAYGDLIIDGTIPILAGSGGGITLISLTGVVSIGPTGRIEPVPVLPPMPPATTKTGAYALALGTPGAPAGFIKIVAPVVVIQGLVVAEPGGSGSSTWATGTPAGMFGGTAVALGGSGGFGGTVLVCAQEQIRVSGAAMIRGGFGGTSGHAGASAANGSRALAAGATGGRGGDVVFTGTGAAACQMQIAATGGFAPSIRGGAGGWSGLIAVSSSGGNGSTSNLLDGAGGDAMAVGGRGGDGGSVRFVNCEVSRNASVAAGAGGFGGSATAFGGAGAPAIAFVGWPGGDATAEGGDGGFDGAPLSYLLIGGGSATVAPPVTPGGRGGNAEAWPGAGGTGGRSPFFSGGGSSGGAQAVGGANPNTGATAFPATNPPVAGAGGPAGAGGTGVMIDSAGAP